MKTPIYDFAREYAQKNALRLHMPAHKGVSFLGCEALDLTEIAGADSLYHADGIILESEKNASSLFGSRHTFYSAEGSSLCIRAMLYLIKREATALGRSPFILAGRNAHKTFITAAALLDVDVDWIYPRDGSYLSCSISPEELDSMLSVYGEKPTAIYLTSPDYLGSIADIKGISEVCERHGVLLAVDNAHGAYLKFLSPSRHPLDLGAHICCDSAHKTLPVLTGGAYLHISKKAPELFYEEARNALSLFGSTSPSYLILESLDLANKYISEDYGERLAVFIESLDLLKSRLAENGYTLMGNEPMKLTVYARDYGYTGESFAAEISARGGEIEFSDPDVTVMMPSPELGFDGLEKLLAILLDIPRRQPLSRPSLPSPRPEKALSPREALFSECEDIPTEKCNGRIQASASVACPPAVPIVICGEKIDIKTVELFNYYGIKKCRVVKQ